MPGHAHGAPPDRLSPEARGTGTEKAQRGAGKSSGGGCEKPRPGSSLTPMPGAEIGAREEVEAACAAGWCRLSSRFHTGRQQQEAGRSRL